MSLTDAAGGARAARAVGPHPLSRVCNEFIWEGKYDEQGRRRRPEAPVLPLRTVEEWGGGAADDKRQTADGGEGDGDADAGISPPRHLAISPPRPSLLIRADNKLALAALLPEFRGAVDLIYIDPPYDCGLDYRVDVPIGDTSASVHAYRDAWGDGHESYAHMMAERLMLMRELLCAEGCIFVHCDWRASGVMRLLLDDIFGRACFRNEIVWRRAPNLGRQAASSQLGRVVDSIFVYSAREGTPFRGRTPTRSTPVELDRTGKPRGSKWDEHAQAYFTTAPRGDYTDESIVRLRGEGRVWDSPSGKIYIKYFLRRGEDGRWYKDQPVDTLWDDADVRPLRHCSKDELGIGYATQKPEGLLRRIISWACPPGGLVADFFCGSGTTGAVAQQLGRRWIMADLGRQAVHKTRKRVLACANDSSRCAADLSSDRCSFALLDLAPHDRLHWFARTFADRPAYRQSILSHVSPDIAVQRHALIHARRDDTIFHVAEVDQIVDAPLAETLAHAARVAGALRVVCFALEYAIDIRRDLDAIEAATGVRVHPVLIPPEITEPNRRELPAWLEVARLEVQVTATTPTHAAVRLVHYEPVVAEGLVPNIPRSSHAHAGLDLVDSWSIDPNWRPDFPLRPAWHAQRTPRKRTLTLESEPVALDAAIRSLLVRVIDVFGHETRTLVTVPPNG